MVNFLLIQIDVTFMLRLFQYTARKISKTDSWQNLISMHFGFNFSVSIILSFIVTLKKLTRKKFFKILLVNNNNLQLNGQNDEFILLSSITVYKNYCK